MAEPLPSKPSRPDDESAAGAPIAKDAIDPELVKLRRPPPKIGMVTAAGILGLCVLFWVRLGPDRRFASSSSEPRQVAVGDVLAGRVEPEQLVAIGAEPLMAHAVRASTNKGHLGMRVTPVRGTGDRLWIVLSGDGYSPVSEAAQYRGRLRRLRELPFTADVSEHLAKSPRPVFASPKAVRAAFASGALRTVTGDEYQVRDSDEVAVDVVELDSSVVVVSFNERQPDAAAWAAKLTELGLLPSAQTAPQQTSPEAARFTVAISPVDAAKKLEQAGLWAARVEPVLRNLRGTWGQLKASPADRLMVGQVALTDVQIDLVGVLAARGLPADAYALVTSENPGDYWYVPLISYALLGFAVLFGWALVRAVRRDLLAPRAG